MKTVLKYSVQEVIRMRKNAQILSVGHQDGYLFVWALAETDEYETEERWFEIFGTGREIKEDIKDLKFIGRVTVGTLEWHIFELKRS